MLFYRLLTNLKFIAKRSERLQFRVKKAAQLDSKPTATELRKDCWLMLAHAVDRAAFADNVAAIKPDNLAIWITIGDNLQGFSITLRLTIARHQHRTIQDKIVHVARGQALTF